MASIETQKLATSKGHQWLTLIGASFVLFEFVFLQLYSDNFWFSLNLTWFGIPAIIAVATVGHFVLLFAQSKYGCHFFSPIWKGAAPIAYTRWLTIDTDGFTYGSRHVRWEVIDAIELTIFGNLLVKSRTLCGNEQEQPDIIFRFPFAAAAQPQQHIFIDALKAARSDVVINKRLIKKLDSPIVKGQNFVQALGAMIMLACLVDLGHGSFFYLDMMKHYYLAELNALDGQTKDAEQELKLADDARAHPLPFSWITQRFLNEKSSAANIVQTRAQVLWDLGRKKEAVAEAKAALEYVPESFRAYLFYARMLEESGETKEARKQILIAIDKHKDSLLPRLYLMASGKAASEQSTKPLYKQMMDTLNERDFCDEPRWPPGAADAALTDPYFSKDIYFIYNRLLGVPLPQERISSE